MSPERILKIVERFENRIYPIFRQTTDTALRRHLNDRLDHACFLRIYCGIVMDGGTPPSVLAARRHRL